MKSLGYIFIAFFVNIFVVEGASYPTKCSKDEVIYFDCESETSCTWCDCKYDDLVNDYNDCFDYCCDDCFENYANCVDECLKFDGEAKNKCQAPCEQTYDDCTNDCGQTCKSEYDMKKLERKESCAKSCAKSDDNYVSMPSQGYIISECPAGYTAQGSNEYLGGNTGCAINIQGYKVLIEKSGEDCPESYTEVIYDNDKWVPYIKNCEDYNINHDQCTKCTEDSKSIPAYEGKSCKKCPWGFTPDNEQTVCIDNVRNCDTYDENDDTVCSKCKTESNSISLIPSSDGSVCVPSSIEHCSSYNNDGTCKICDDDFKPSSDGSVCNKKNGTKRRCGPGIGSCPNDQCCSQYGYCGTSIKYCGVGCQIGFGKCNDNDIDPTISNNGRCGPDFGNTICPNNQCCSTYGYCGTTEKHCVTKCLPDYGRCL